VEEGRCSKAGDGKEVKVDEGRKVKR